MALLDLVTDVVGQHPTDAAARSVVEIDFDRVDRRQALASSYPRSSPPTTAGRPWTPGRSGRGSGGPARQRRCVDVGTGEPAGHPVPRSTDHGYSELIHEPLGRPRTMAPSKPRFSSSRVCAPCVATYGLPTARCSFSVNAGTALPSCRAVAVPIDVSAASVSALAAFAHAAPSVAMPLSSTIFASRFHCVVASAIGARGVRPSGHLRREHPQRAAHGVVTHDGAVVVERRRHRLDRRVLHARHRRQVHRRRVGRMQRDDRVGDRGDVVGPRCRRADDGELPSRARRCVVRDLASGGHGRIVALTEVARRRPSVAHYDQCVPKSSRLS